MPSARGCGCSGSNEGTLSSLQADLRSSGYVADCTAAWTTSARGRSAGLEALASNAHNPQAVEREAAVQLQAERLVALDAAESGLCFGRLDRRDGDVPRYVGRIGLSDDARRSRC